MVDNKYSSLFHNGGLQSVALTSNDPKLLKFAATFHINTQEPSLENIFADDTLFHIVYLVDPQQDQVNKLLL